MASICSDLSHKVTSRELRPEMHIFVVGSITRQNIISAFTTAGSVKVAKTLPELKELDGNRAHLYLNFFESMPLNTKILYKCALGEYLDHLQQCLRH